MSVIDTSDYISGILFNSEINLAYVSAYKTTSTDTKTYTYKSNKLSNNTTLIATCWSDYSTSKAQATIKLNGETILDTTYIAWGTTKTGTYQLTDGDVIETYVYAYGGISSASATCKILCKGYLMTV